MQKQKEVIYALTKAQLSQNSSERFNDIVQGKGKELNILLQYAIKLNVYKPTTNTKYSGPPGVGKILTAEAILEHFQRPLYIVFLY